MAPGCLSIGTLCAGAGVKWSPGAVMLIALDMLRELCAGRVRVAVTLPWWGVRCDPFGVFREL